MPKPRLSLFDPNQKTACRANSFQPPGSAGQPSGSGGQLGGSPAANPASRNQTRRDLELDRAAGVAAAKSVSLPLSALLPLLTEAAQSDRAWLKDFADDTVRIDADLYEVLLAYQQLQDRAA